MGAVQCRGGRHDPLPLGSRSQEAQSYSKECHLKQWVPRLDLEAYQVDLSAMNDTVPVLSEVMA